MADRWGENFVNSNWFTQLRTSANHWMADQTGAARIRSGLFNVASDLATTIFRGPLSENIFTYMEEQRLLARQGFLITNFSPYHHTALARGKQLFSLKNRPPQKIGVIALVRNTILGIAGMIGIKVLGEGVLRGSNVLTSVGSQSSQALLSRAATLARNTIQNIRVAKQKTNIWFIIGGATFLFILIVLPMLGQDMINSSLATTSEGGMGNEAHVPPPDFGPINGSITDCVTSQGTNIEGTQTLTLTAGRAGQIQSISQKYPQLGCYSQVLQCPTTKINITAFAVQSGGLGGYAPSGMPGNIIFYPAFFAYGDYDFARTLAHEMMHEVEWLHSDIYDAFINGTTDGSFPKGYCGPLGTYTAGNENSYETMSEAAGLYMVGNPLLQQKCQSAYDFMKKLFSQCQQ